MTHLQIFQPSKERVELAHASTQIVNTLSNHHAAIIHQMVARTDATKKTYLRNVSHFLAFIQANGIDSHSFGAYRNALQTLDGVSVKTKNAYLAAAKALLKEALKYNIIPVDITENVPAFKVARKHVKDGLTRADVVKVYEYIKSIKNACTRRKMACMFALFANEGLRQHEVQKLRVVDVNLKESCIMVHGKGKDERERFYIMDATAVVLRQYMDACGTANGYLFPSPGAPEKPVSLRAIRKYFTCPKYGIFTRAGVAGKSVHGFRHFNITETLRATGGDLARTRRRSRHAGFEMLVVYDDERLSKADVAEIENHISVM